jgi:hypothetical protein
MPTSPRAKTLFVVGAGVLILAGMLGVALWNARIPTDPGSLLKRLPTQDAAVVGVDFAALRRDGFVQWLDRSKTPEEPDYLAFVQETGFDYKRDLDYVLASFAPDGEFFLVKGAFNWAKIEEYVLRQHGSCFDHLCRVSGSTPERHISFFPLKHNLMAMAVATDDTAAARLQKPGPQSDIDVPAAPVWMTLSAGALRGSRHFTEFASALTGANRVTLTAAPSGAAFEARLDAICRDAQQAGALTMQLRTLTNMLPRDAGGVAGLLRSGTFEQSSSHVFGHWPVSTDFVQSIAAP